MILIVQHQFNIFLFPQDPLQICWLGGYKFLSKLDFSVPISNLCKHLSHATNYKKEYLWEQARVDIKHFNLFFLT